MAVPAVKNLFRPILEIAAEAGGIFPYKQLFEKLTVRLSLTEADLAELVPSKSLSKVKNRTYVAAYHLKRSNLLTTEGGEGVKITPEGLAFLDNHQGDIERSDLTKLAAAQGEGFDLVDPIPDASDEIAPDEQIAISHQQHHEMLSDQILDSMKSLEPAGFERLVVGLLAKMGYGDGQVTGKSGDQGIDGILDEDTLGLEKVYIQAKRYDTSQVGEPEIRNFSGSLVAQGATKGVFITTSTFSTTARQTAQSISMGNQFIRLVDGRELAELMIRHGVGVVTEITYEVKKLDANYFAEV